MSSGQKKAYEDDMELRRREILNKVYANLDENPDHFLVLLENIKANIDYLRGADIQLTRRQFRRIDNISNNIEALLK